MLRLLRKPKQLFSIMRFAKNFLSAEKSNNNYRTFYINQGVITHYSCFVFTKEFPDDDVLYRALMPFNRYNNDGETKEYPDFFWDWFKVGGRYSGMLKLEIRKNDEKYRWGFYSNVGRNGKLFRSTLIDTIDKFKQASRDGWMFNEEDVYGELGRWDGYIRVDACPVVDILNIKKISCYCFIDKNGNA